MFSYEVVIIRLARMVFGIQLDFPKSVNVSSIY